MAVKSQPTPAPEVAPAETNEPVKLHTWVKFQPTDQWSYCGVCRAIRHPNGKLDGQACRGYYKIPPKPVKTRPPKI
jgi:hypothetical protein